MCPNFGTLKSNKFSIWNKWKIYYFKVSQYLRTLRYFLAKNGSVLLRARRNEKDLKVKPATSFKYFQYLLTKIKTKFKAEKI